ncbi:hypothetical protein PAHAL_3G208300 [Panicum hallii]|uniref:Uncharacterized protein n=1 Tax=Panicum hallii TaxID=206008 RepID=A0A2T8KIV4_9POAL|nr:hypothetical protein PAHAL_3G208300 [Panicum hallii]
MGHQPLAHKLHSPTATPAVAPRLPIAEASQCEPLHHPPTHTKSPSPSPDTNYAAATSIHPIDHITSPALARISVAPSGAARLAWPWPAGGPSRPRLHNPPTPIIHPTRARNAERGRRRCRRRRL